MSTETLEPAAPVPAGPVTTEIAEPPILPVPPLPAVHAHACANCKAPIAGRYCQECGQSAHVHRSMAHIFEEVAHGVLHFEAKSWRTLPLLLARPGLLTRRYIDGQRVKYVSPLALFLFSVFLMFFANSLLDKPPDKLAPTPPRAASAPASPQATAPASPQTAAPADESVARHLVRQSRENPALTWYKLKSASYKFAFLLVPLSLPFMWLMFFWHKDVRLYDHAIFTLYSLSFMSLWFIVMRLAGVGPVGGGVMNALAVYPAIHVFLHLKEAYRLGWGGALWRTFALLFASFVVLLMFLGTILFIALY
jgi:hypothetical protein